MSQDLQKLRHRQLLEDLRHGSATPSIGRGDARNDLGYGKTAATFHNQRSRNSTYPYTDPDEYDDLEYDEGDIENVSAVQSKSLNPHPTDSYAGYKNNPFYFVAGNTKLSDCITHPGQIIIALTQYDSSLSIDEESSVVTNSLVPKPGIWRRAVKSGGQGAATYVTNAHPFRTGTKRGWSLAPEQTEEESNSAEEDLIANGEFLSVWDIIDRNNIQ